MNNAVFNPQGKPIEDLPTIYGFNNGGDDNWWYGQLMAEDGTPLGSHVCSHECYMRGDLGIDEGSRADRHEHFQKHYPNGYQMEFVSLNDVRTHEKLTKAIKLAQEKDNPERHPMDASVAVTFSDGSTVTTHGDGTRTETPSVMPNARPEELQKVIDHWTNPNNRDIEYSGNVATFDMFYGYIQQLETKISELEGAQ